MIVFDQIQVEEHAYTQLFQNPFHLCNQIQTPASSQQTFHNLIIIFCMCRPIQIVLLIIFIVPISSQTASTILGPIKTHPYTTTTSSPYINFNMKVTLPSQFSPVLMVISNSATPPSTNWWDYTINPALYTYMDIEGCNTGRTQYAWIANLGIGSTVYVYIISFNHQITYGYIFSVMESNIIAMACPTSSGYCASCFGLDGVYCSISKYQVYDSLQSYPLSPYSYTSFLLILNNPVKLHIIAQNAPILAFIQYKTFNYELAGILDYNQYVSLATGKTYQVDLEQKNVDVLIGVVNDNSGIANVNIWATEIKFTNIVLIILGVIGGLLFLALVITGCYIFRKSKEEARIVHPVRLQHLRQSTNTNRLTDQQIQSFFPSFISKNVFLQVSGSELSIGDLNDDKKIEDRRLQDRQCAICLCETTFEDILKATYCRHVFHANCLTTWFKKQRNCPYCRQQFTKSSTLEQYNKIVELSKSKGLGGIALIKQIFNSKQLQTFQTLQAEDIKQNDYY